MWEFHWFQAHLRVVLGCGEGLGGGGSTEQGRSAVEENGQGGAPVRIGRGEVVGELRGLTVELARGSERAEEGRSYEFHCGQAVAELGLRRRGGSGGN